MFLTFSSYAQDSIVLESSISEKKQINFEQYFFDAITQKAIYNYQKAIDYLEECNAIIPDNKAVLFELSKNYYFLNKLPEAIIYGNKALELEANNVWILEHLVNVYKKSRNFEAAIAIQQKLGERFPKKKRPLVYLHLQNNDRNSAKKVLEELATAKLLNSRLRSLRTKILRIGTPTPPKKLTTSKTTVRNNLEERFEKEKSFTNLSDLLVKLDKDGNNSLLGYSEQGISLFPAQPFVYLMNGKALNKNKQFKKAIESLQNGIDFVIDDQQLENHFYNELVKAYKALGDTKNVNKYQKKIK
ncbi:tetratricopeptide repeat protein [Tenacibaculum amylolyticum]|uniref:tetratricopeptide repeat protein n=1 Tax=Tenacibaculum amylolyticum TaxID=104269 RepID=UPI003894F86A